MFQVSRVTYPKGKQQASIATSAVRPTVCLFISGLSTHYRVFLLPLLNKLKAATSLEETLFFRFIVRHLQRASPSRTQPVFNYFFLSNLDRYKVSTRQDIIHIYQLQTDMWSVPTCLLYLFLASKAEQLLHFGINGVFFKFWLFENQLEMVH